MAIKKFVEFNFSLPSGDYNLNKCCQFCHPLLHLGSRLVTLVASGYQAAITLQLVIIVTSGRESEWGTALDSDRKFKLYRPEQPILDVLEYWPHKSLES